MLAYVINISLKDFISNLPFYEEKFKTTILNLIHYAQDSGFQIDKAKIMETLSRFGRSIGYNIFFVWDERIGGLVINNMCKSLSTNFIAGIEKILPKWGSTGSQILK